MEKCKDKGECVNRCIFDELGLLDADNTFHVDVFPEDFHPRAKECFEKFKDLKGCEQATKIAECFPKKP